MQTARLHLVPSSIGTLESELVSNSALAAALGVHVPDNWPPELYDADAVRWSINALQTDPAMAEWGSRYVILPSATPTLIGMVGYTGPPDDDGIVEIGYGILDQYRRRGYATEASRALIERAFADPRVRVVIAQTLPELTPSIGVMEKCGFVLEGPGSEEGVIRYRLDRPADHLILKPDL